MYLLLYTYVHKEAKILTFLSAGSVTYILVVTQALVLCLIRIYIVALGSCIVMLNTKCKQEFV